MPKVDLDAIAPISRTGYPEPFDAAVAGRWYRRLGGVSGLTHFGASHVVLKPGAWSSQRHWHKGEDELLVMVSGEAVLVEDDGRETLRAGDICAWPAGVANGHHLVNESDADCAFVVIGAGHEEGCEYSDIDMRFTPQGDYVRKDGTPYPAKRAP